MRSVLFVSVKLSNVYRGLCMDGSQSHSISNSVFISFFSFFSSYFSSFIHSTSSKIIWENGVPRARSDWRDKPIPRRCTEIIDSTYGNFRVVPSAWKKHRSLIKTEKQTKISWIWKNIFYTIFTRNDFPKWIRWHTDYCVFS